MQWEWEWYRLRSSLGISQIRLEVDTIISGTGSEIDVTNNRYIFIYIIKDLLRALFDRLQNLKIKYLIASSLRTNSNCTYVNELTNLQIHFGCLLVFCLRSTSWRS